MHDITLRAATSDDAVFALHVTEACVRVWTWALKGDLDITRWLQWFLACLNRAFDGAEDILANVLRTARFWDKHAGAALNERQRDMLDRLLSGFEGNLTSSKWAKLKKCSQDTALRDIDDLIGRGILKKEAGGRSTRYSLAED
jgi:Fic family protein